MGETKGEGKKGGNNIIIFKYFFKLPFASIVSRGFCWTCDETHSFVLTLIPCSMCFLYLLVPSIL